MTTAMLSASPGIAPSPTWTVRRVLALVERNMMIYRRSVTPLAFGLVEPVMYLLSIGFGVGSLVGTVPGRGRPLPRLRRAGDPGHDRDEHRVQPDQLRRLHPDQGGPDLRGDRPDAAVGHRHRARRGRERRAQRPADLDRLPAGGPVLGLVVSPGILLAIPAAALVGFAFAAGGLAVTTFLRDFSDFQLVQLVMLPMYLFATTFYPLSIYPGWLRPLIEALPLYQSIELIRGPALGSFDGPALLTRRLLPGRVRHRRHDHRRPGGWNGCC